MSRAVCLCVRKTFLPKKINIHVYTKAPNLIWPDVLRGDEAEGPGSPSYPNAFELNNNNDDLSPFSKSPKTSAEFLSSMEMLKILWTTFLLIKSINHPTKPRTGSLVFSDHISIRMMVYARPPQQAFAVTHDIPNVLGPPVPKVTFEKYINHL